ncbi:protein of unknown function (plasmid) [Cupriavidus taiwanensis]|uniref:Uncharacterized protein n=1 Tax=Cupriavidus taiwanensis TaxID=164546 RepID=A0A375IN23_9BURK|nr:hypothetical protein CBM2608_B30159 [Cupriavidus taiwanensis]SPA34509.1 hypothetical protein CBM2623_B30156 [Cupriavidus taiwanensis]SPA52195.1 hypothetical protein CBM2629_B40136 [Cupriavidus taiwanensis]SPK75927.1 protein of unknown function [Cupriavidus taiwanensis]
MPDSAEGERIFTATVSCCGGRSAPALSEIMIHLRLRRPPREVKDESRRVSTYLSTSLGIAPRGVFPYTSNLESEFYLCMSSSPQGIVTPVE